MRRGAAALLALLAGCTGEVEDTSTSEGACGDVTEHDFTIRGKVLGVQGAVAPDVEVSLVDRAWNTGDVLGTALTGDDGLFELDALGVTSVENCWGTLLNYVLVADDGEHAGEKGVNGHLYSAIQDGNTELDLTGLPIELE